MQTQSTQPQTAIAKPTTTFLVYHQIKGVFLGEVMGLAFWSNLETLDSTEACGFASEVKALNTIVRLQEWSVESDDPIGTLISIVPVKTAELGLATRAECEAAGLPTWDIGDETRRYRYRLQKQQGYVIHASDVELTYEQIQAIAAQL